MSNLNVNENTVTTIAPVATQAPIEVRQNSGVNTASMQYVEDVINNSEPNLFARIETSMRNWSYNRNLAKKAFDTKTKVTDAHYTSQQIQAKMQHDTIVTNQKLEEAENMKKLIPKQKEALIVRRQQDQDGKMDRNSKVIHNIGLFLCLVSALTTIAGVTKIYNVNQLININFIQMIFIMATIGIQTALYKLSCGETFLLREHKTDYRIPYFFKYLFIGVSIYGTFTFFLIAQPPSNWFEYIVVFTIAFGLDPLAFGMVNMANNIYYKNNTNSAKEISIMKNIKSAVASTSNKVRDIQSRLNTVKTAQREDTNVSPTLPTSVIVETKEIKQAKEKTPSKLKHKEAVASGRKKKDIDNVYKNVVSSIENLDNKTNITSKKLNMNISEHYWKQIKTLLIENKIVFEKDKRIYKNI